MAPNYRVIGRRVVPRLSTPVSGDADCPGSYCHRYRVTSLRKRERNVPSGIAEVPLPYKAAIDGCAENTQVLRLPT